MKYPCSLCATKTAEKDLCEQLACRKCHVSITFEDCVEEGREQTRRVIAELERSLKR